MNAIARDLRAALEAVDEAGVPADLRHVAFAAAFWAARSDGPTDQRVAVNATPRNESSKSVPATSDHILTLLTEKLGVSSAEIEFIYETDDDLSVRVPPSRLAPKRRDAIEQLIYLVAAGRQAVGLESKTPAQIIKDVCAERGRPDPNFSRTLTELHGKGIVVGGKGREKTVSVNAAGFEHAGTIVRALNESVK